MITPHPSVSEAATAAILAAPLAQSTEHSRFTARTLPPPPRVTTQKSCHAWHTDSEEPSGERTLSLSSTPGRLCVLGV